MQQDGTSSGWVKSDLFPDCKSTLGVRTLIDGRRREKREKGKKEEKRLNDK